MRKLYVVEQDEEFKYCQALSLKGDVDQDIDDDSSEEVPLLSRF